MKLTISFKNECFLPITQTITNVELDDPKYIKVITPYGNTEIMKSTIEKMEISF